MAGFGREVGGPLDDVGVDSIIAFVRSLQTEPRVEPPPFTATSDAENGRLVYEKHCQKCHGTVAQRANAVHLFNPALLATASDAFLRYAVVMGRPNTPMEAFAPVLDGRSTNDVVTYIRSQAGKLPPLSSLQVSPPPAFPPAAGALHSAPPGAPPVPAWGPIPLNPQGGAPKFTLRDGRFAPMAEVKKALDEKKKLIIVDARAPSDWLTLHIPGSVSLPYYDLALIDRIPNDDTWVIAYCGCPHHASGEVVDALRRRGHKNSAVLDEGMFAWQKANYPVVQAPGMAGIAAPPVYDTHGHPQPLPSGPGPTKSPKTPK
jgi:rhodanese-related sulfurtransferase/mono/diheme cytochrome c family protein